MKVVVDLNVCDLHGLCVETAPEVFEMGDDGALRVLNATPPEDLRGKVDKAAMVEAGRVARTAGASLFPPADRWTRPMMAIFGATKKGHPGPK